MATPLYTGQGMQTPRTEGRALQALSQYGQQEQIRSTQKIQQGVRDRDKFAAMLKLDPVYATSKQAQDNIAGIMDNFLDKMTAINREKRGTFSTEDLMNMQQERGIAQAQMNYIKSASDQISQAYQLNAANPGKFNQRMLEDAHRQWDEQGTLPEGPILIPAFQDPQQRWHSFGQQFRQGASWSDAGKPYQDEAGAWTQNQQRVYPLQGGNTEEDVSGMFMSGWEEQNNFGWFAETIHDSQPKVWNHYMEKAGNDELAASKMWFQENKGPLYPDSGRQQHSRPTSSSRIGGDNLRLVDGALWDGKYQQFDTAQNIPVSDGVVDNGILFNRTAAGKNLIPVPSRLLELEEGIETKGGTVEARVHVADNDKTYLVIDKKSLDKVSFTKSFAEAYMAGVMQEDPERKGFFRIQEGAEDDAMIPISTDDARGLIDGWTGGYFSEALTKLPQTTKTKIDW